jgi:hypothetical protein
MRHSVMLDPNSPRRRVLYFSWKWAREIRNIIYGADRPNAWHKPDALYHRSGW